MGVYATLAALCAVAGLGVPLAYLAAPDMQEQLRLELALQPANLAGAIAVCFIIPAGVRTVRPDFAMTVGRAFGVVGIAIVTGAATEVGLLLLVVPGIWFGVKWSLTTWTYLLSDGKNPFGESWEITTGHFWETLAYAVLMSILLGIVLSLGFFLPVFLAYLVPVLAVLLAPIAFFGYLFANHVALLGQMRFMLELRRLAAAG